MIWTCGHEHRSREEAIRCQRATASLECFGFTKNELGAVLLARLDEKVRRLTNGRPIVDRYREAER